MIPDFQTWQHSRPLPPGTKIRLDSGGGYVWWHGLEATIIQQDPKSLYLYRITPIKDPAGHLQNMAHRDNFVVINP